MEKQLINYNDITSIAQIAPDAVTNNQTSAAACLQYGENLLRIAEEEGMNDELDEKLANYIKRSRSTIQAMTDRRKPVTQLFDNIRSGFTQLESSIDPKVAGSPANKAQKLRDDYARKKHEEEQRRRKEAELLARKQQERAKYREDLEQELFGFFNQKTTQSINKLITLNKSITLQTFDAVSADIQSFDCTFPVSELSRYTFGVMLPSSLDMTEIQTIQKEVLQKGQAMMEQYKFDVQDQKDSIMQVLPSKYNELLAIEEQRKTDEQAALLREEEMKRKEAEEQARQDLQRKQEEEKKKHAEELLKQQSAAANLFQASSTTFVSSPEKKIKVKKSVNVLNPIGYAEIFNYWWINEGQHLNEEELKKIFKKQITYAEKAANQTRPDFIQSDNIQYIDDVKAK